MRRLGILGSTAGTNLLALIAAIQQKKLDAMINVVVSNKKEAFILEKARSHHIVSEFFDSSLLSREDYDSQLSALFKKYEVDFIILIGYMRILSNAFISIWRNKIINVHPSLLPQFSGLMNKAVHQAVLDSGIKETGCTIHFVTEELDAGPILLQKKCFVSSEDTVESLKKRVQELEGEALIEAIQNL